MKISAKIDYACRALLELSLHWPNPSPLPIQEIARRQKIPMKFLVHILIHLKQLDYLESVRGKNGGYVLTKSPREIKLSPIMKSFGVFGQSSSLEAKRARSHHVMDTIWQEINKTVSKAIEQIDFEMICQRSHNKNKSLMYEI